MPVSVDVHVAEGIGFEIPVDRVERAVETVLAHEGVVDAEVSYAFLDDDAIAALNREHLDHEGPTDVISFPLSAEGQPLVGDVYIGALQARRQAAELGVPLDEEMLRLVVHGTLHVLGYEHPEEEDREGSEMYVRQEALLAEILDAAADAPEGGTR